MPSERELWGFHCPLTHSHPGPGSGPCSTTGACHPHAWKGRKAGHDTSVTLAPRMSAMLHGVPLHSTKGEVSKCKSQRSLEDWASCVFNSPDISCILISSGIPKHLLNTDLWCPSSQHRVIQVLLYLLMNTDRKCVCESRQRELTPLETNTEMETKGQTDAVKCLLGLSYLFPLSLFCPFRHDTSAL